MLAVYLRRHPGRKRIEASFSAKAPRYDENAAVQERAGRRLAALIEREGGILPPCADLGCGTGMIYRMGSAPGRVVGVDLSMEMLGRFRRSVRGAGPVRADVEDLPIRDSCLGTAIMSLVLQWAESPRRAVREAVRCLRKGGLLGFSVLLKGTLQGLYDLAGEMGRRAPVYFFERDEFNALLSAEGMELLSEVTCSEVQHFAGAREALKSLSAVGATASGGPPMTRSELEAFCREYERRFETGRGVPLTWTVLTGLARKRG